MNTPAKLIPALILALAAVGSASAQTKEEDHKAHHPQAATTAPASAPKPAAGMHEMHEKHQKEMGKIHGTKDPVKRQKLMAKHKKEMHEHMDKGMMGKGMGASAPGGDMKPGMGVEAPMGAKPMQGAASK